MRVPAGFVVIPLLAGAAVGIHINGDAGALILPACFAALISLLAGLAFCADREEGGVLIALVVGAAASGYAGGAAHSRALEAPPLLAWFDARDRGESDPVTLIGRLRDDGASVGPRRSAPPSTTPQRDWSRRRDW